ncbi:GIY-YIG nuclease family protein [Aquibacillus rhizosphaerae]|uniref:GIY-YIG nuclease family protein n=1 Tax=Aquibacillus rhizosphaerae TaxID=3051431 RepID=A0ABT7L9E0_9BACI|nr:GIY-YIG nuclease family protein [Aquibacillus sp. LR5S19]MDL4842478.1 GIY-YIG nuclease family protein [Aquibacillus sp. LR5S19]
MDFLFFLSFGLIIFILLVFLFQAREQSKIRKQIFELANNTLELTPEDFLEMRNKSFGGKGKALYSNNYNFSGVYILYNQSKDLYYVGQGKQVLNRVNSHFTGRGNGDVYADYKYGDFWTIKMIALKNSGFSTLNELEKSAIETYDSFNKGYNKTRGNKR